MVRPKTAATTTKKDEERIKQKMQALINIERKIEDDLEEFQNKRRDTKGKKDDHKGIHVTKQMILAASQCDTLSEVQTLILRDKNIEVFENHKESGLNLDELVNIECVFASHNKIKDLYGIS